MESKSKGGKQLGAILHKRKGQKQAECIQLADDEILQRMPKLVVRGVSARDRAVCGGDGVPSNDQSHVQESPAIQAFPLVSRAYHRGQYACSV